MSEIYGHVGTVAGGNVLKFFYVIVDDGVEPVDGGIVAFVHLPEAGTGRLFEGAVLIRPAAADEAPMPAVGAFGKVYSVAGEGEADAAGLAMVGLVETYDVSDAVGEADVVARTLFQPVGEDLGFELGFYLVPPFDEFAVELLEAVEVLKALEAVGVADFGEPENDFGLAGGADAGGNFDAGAHGEIAQLPEIAFGHGLPGFDPIG